MARHFPALLASSAFAGLLFASVGCLPPSKADTTPTTCAEEANEPNDSEETAEDLGELSDDPNSRRAIASSVHTASDADWYRVHIVDRGAGGDPNIDVLVSSGFTVSTWFVCDGGKTSNLDCTYGDSDYVRVGNVEGCRGKELEDQKTPEGSTIVNADVAASSTTDCSGTTSDDGTLYIRVDRAASAGKACSYDLTIHVD